MTRKDDRDRPRKIDAKTAPQWGVVSEVVPHALALERGIEIAHMLAVKPYRSL